MKLLSVSKLVFLGIFFLPISLTSSAQVDTTISRLIVQTLNVYYSDYTKECKIDTLPNYLNYFVLLSDSITNALDLDKLKYIVWVLERKDVGKRFVSDHKEYFSVETVWFEKKGKDAVDVFIKSQVGGLATIRLRENRKIKIGYAASFNVCDMGAEWVYWFPYCRFTYNNSTNSWECKKMRNFSSPIE